MYIKGHYQESKRQLTKWEKISAYHVSQTLGPRIHANSYNLIAKSQNSPEFKNEQSKLSKRFPDQQSQ